MYECHLTFELQGHPNWDADNRGWQVDDIRTYGSTHGWKMSRIDGDPGLGAGERIYLTCHDADLKTIFAKMQAAVEAAGTFPHVWMPRPVREKIEHIIHDPKYGVSLATAG